MNFGDFEKGDVSPDTSPFFILETFEELFLSPGFHVFFQ